MPPYVFNPRFIYLNSFPSESISLMHWLVAIFYMSPDRLFTRSLYKHDPRINGVLSSGSHSMTFFSILHSVTLITVSLPEVLLSALWLLEWVVLGLSFCLNYCGKVQCLFPTPLQQWLPLSLLLQQTPRCPQPTRIVPSLRLWTPWRLNWPLFMLTTWTDGSLRQRHTLGLEAFWQMTWSFGVSVRHWMPKCPQGWQELSGILELAKSMEQWNLFCFSTFHPASGNYKEPNIF